jgi:uncharacterized protein YecT (DUF1311 family)
MLRMLIFVAGIVVAAAAFAQSNAEVERRYSKDFSRCMEGSEGQSTYGMLDCINKELQKQDAALNATYKKLMARLTPARQKKLRQLQRDWIKRRDAVASESAAEWEGGTGAPVAYKSALLQETVRRTIWLERYR